MASYRSNVGKAGSQCLLVPMVRCVCKHGLSGDQGQSQGHRTAARPEGGTMTGGESESARRAGATGG